MYSMVRLIAWGRDWWRFRPDRRAEVHRCYQFVDWKARISCVVVSNICLKIVIHLIISSHLLWAAHCYLWGIKRKGKPATEALPHKVYFLGADHLKLLVYRKLIQEEHFAHQNHPIMQLHYFNWVSFLFYLPHDANVGTVLYIYLYLVVLEKKE